MSFTMWTLAVCTQWWSKEQPWDSVFLMPFPFLKGIRGVWRNEQVQWNDFWRWGNYKTEANITLPMYACTLQYIYIYIAYYSIYILHMRFTSPPPPPPLSYSLDELVLNYSSNAGDGFHCTLRWPPGTRPPRLKSSIRSFSIDSGKKSGQDLALDNRLVVL